jgi:hypothetical protein
VSIVVLIERFASDYLVLKSDTVISILAALCGLEGIREGKTQWRTQKFFGPGGRVQQIQLRTEGRVNGDLVAVVP